MTDLLETRTANGVRWIELNRPARRNALNRELVSQLTSAVRAAAGSDEARVVVLRGQGGAFCAGGDLDELEGLRSGPNEQLIECLGEFHELILSVVECPVPVLAAWQGPAAGFGGDLALATDLRVADESAFFQASFIHVGLVPDGGGTYLLPTLIGHGLAFEWLSLGSRVEANRLLEAGVVQRVLAKDRFLEEVTAIAEALAERAPLALRALKAMLSRERHEMVLKALADSRDIQPALLQSEDFEEGVRAFREKRKALFRGR